MIEIIKDGNIVQKTKEANVGKCDSCSYRGAIGIRIA
jgi:hypothetical protein